jgi:hypothetical protein
MKKSNMNALVYLFKPEDSTGEPWSEELCRAANGPLGLVKLLFWTGVSMALSVGISQLI